MKEELKCVSMRRGALFVDIFLDTAGIIPKQMLFVNSLDILVLVRLHALNVITPC